MYKIQTKKHLGQHFLQDNTIANNIVDALTITPGQSIIEIGPGKGVLTTRLLKKTSTLFVVEVDPALITYLHTHFVDQLSVVQIIAADFLDISITEKWNKEQIKIISNLPYNIASQVFFKVLHHRDQVEEMVCMVQKEVAERIVAPPGNKTYGILSVLLQAFYHVEYLFTVPPSAFNPAPKVTSSVIKLRRNQVKKLACNEKIFFQLVKTGFSQRRKMLKNTLKSLSPPPSLMHYEKLHQRAENLSVKDFVQLTQLWTGNVLASEK